jgi:hypothetical protein
MSPKELVAKCEAFGVTLAPGDGEKLRISPPGVLPDHVKRLLRAHKQAVLNLLAPPPERGCYTCQQHSFWQHAVTYAWICSVCHPAPHPELIEAVHEAPKSAVPWIGIDRRPRDQGSLPDQNEALSREHRCSP